MPFIYYLLEKFHLTNNSRVQYPPHKKYRCLLPLMIYHYIITLNGRYMIINGIPHWCAQYENVSFEPGSTVPILKGFFEIEYAEDPFIE